MRPKKTRWVGCQPGDRCFRPLHVPRNDRVVTRLTLDELEALRLCDGMRLEQGIAAKKMKVHRAAVSRIFIEARKKVANALVHCHGIKIEGGCFKVMKEKTK
jgi:uncharacterized protein